MRNAVSTDPETASTRFQADDEISEELAHDANFCELLECCRHHYERIDIKKKPVVKETPMATVSWSAAEVLRNASNLAFAIEAHSRGMKLVAAKNILSGRFATGKKPHRRKQQKLKSKNEENTK